MHHLDDQQVAKRLAWPEVLEALRAALASKHRYDTPERVAMPAPRGGTFLTMPCAGDDGLFGVKQVAVLPDNPERGLPSVNAHYTLFGADGRPALSCSATVLTRIRTAAVSAVAADMLVRSRARRLLIVGTGSLAPWMAEAHLQVRPYESVVIWGRSSEKAEKIARELGLRLRGSPVIPAIAVADDLAEAVRESDVVSVATTAREPFIEGNWLKGGQHLDLVGAFVPGMAEASPAAVQGSDVFVDDRAAVRKEAGDLLLAAEQGWSFEEIRGDLGELLRGEVAGFGGGPEEAGNGGASVIPPARAELPTLFKSVGLALEDLAVARLLLE